MVPLDVFTADNLFSLSTTKIRLSISIGATVRKLSLLVPTPISVDQFIIKSSEYDKLPRLFDVFLNDATQFLSFFGLGISILYC